MPLDATADAPRHRRHPGGRPRAIAPRTARVTVRFSSSELAVVADTAGGTPLSDAIRRAALGRRSAGSIRIPPVNADAWQSLARTAANLNQLSFHAHTGGGVTAADLGPVLDRLRSEVQALRCALIGLNIEEASA